jgi:hypothetical protein
MNKNRCTKVKLHLQKSPKQVGFYKRYNLNLYILAEKEVALEKTYSECLIDV